LGNSSFDKSFITRARVYNTASPPYGPYGLVMNDFSLL